MDWPARIFLFVGVAQFARPLQEEHREGRAEFANLVALLAAMESRWSASHLRWSATLLLGAPTQHGLYPQEALPPLIARLFELSLDDGLLNWLETTLAAPDCVEDFLAADARRIAALGLSSWCAPSDWSSLAGSLHALHLAGQYHGQQTGRPARGVDLRLALDGLGVARGKRLARRLAAEMSSHWRTESGSLEERSRGLVQTIESPESLSAFWKPIIDLRMRKLIDRFSAQLDQAGSRLMLAGQLRAFEELMGDASRQLNYARTSCESWRAAVLEATTAGVDVRDGLLAAGSRPAVHSFSRFYPLGLWRLRRWHRRWELAVARACEQQAELDVAAAALSTVAEMEGQLRLAVQQHARFRADLLWQDPLCHSVPRHWYELSAADIRGSLEQRASAFVAARSCLVARLRERCLAGGMDVDRLAALSRVDLPDASVEFDVHTRWCAGAAAPHRDPALLSLVPLSFDAMQLAVARWHARPPLELDLGCPH